MKIGVAIPTLNGEDELRRLLPIVCAEPGISEIAVVDSASTDATCEVVREYSRVRLIEIQRKDFNHGATREFARKELNTEIVVFLTQDIVPLPGFIKPLVEPILTGQAAVTYSRQLPHQNADLFEAFPRTFNYPDKSSRRTLADADRLGVFTFFCSDSCAAYLNAALDRIGGFETILTNEDYFAVAKLLRAGESINYVAESCVHHSHSYTLVQEFQRYFDTGFVRGEHYWVTELVGKAEGHGSKFAMSFLKRVMREKPFSVPYAVLQIAAKWAGYRIGTSGKFLPRFLRKKLSSQPNHWNSVDSP